MAANEAREHGSGASEGDAASADDLERSSPTPGEESDQSRPVELVAAQIVTSEQAVFRGPVPPPEVLAGYEATLPGAADRILAMAERQSRHRQELETTVVAGESKADHWTHRRYRCHDLGTCPGWRVGLFRTRWGQRANRACTHRHAGGSVCVRATGAVGGSESAGWTRRSPRRRQPANRARTRRRSQPSRLPPLARVWTCPSRIGDLLGGCPKHRCRRLCRTLVRPL